MNQQPQDEPKGKNRQRGMDKQRWKKMNESKKKVNNLRVRLCLSTLNPDRRCKYGERCNAEHSLTTYWASKPEDIGDRCVLFEQLGKCPYSFACRFAKAHTRLEDMTQVVDGPVNPLYKPTLNTRLTEAQIQMRKRQYDFSRADRVVADLKKTSTEEAAPSVGAMEREKPKLDMRSLKGKSYLAPLTTAGNLPFRRLCVELGAQITCGEMALATALLQGSQSELSLLKRHPSEKIFGVQIAGGFPDTLARATQLIVDQCEVDFVDLNLGCPIDMVNDKGGGCTLANRPNYLKGVLRAMGAVASPTPVTIKMRYGMHEGERKNHNIMGQLLDMNSGVPRLITIHPRSKDQRYTKEAEWDYVDNCAEAIAGRCPLWGCGDVMNYEDYYNRLETSPIDGVMLGRGPLIKPWLFTEIEERRHWDIIATERLEIIKKFVDHGLEHWGSDDMGVDTTRRFLLEWLSFQCRYVPVGLLEQMPPKISQRPTAPNMGRNEMEVLLGSTASSDWVRISEMFLGKVPEGFLFVPKHRANAY